MQAGPICLYPLVSSLLLVLPLSGQGKEPIDTRAVEVLRAHGLEKSKVMEHLSWICDVYGPRLTNSPNIKRAQAWAQKTFRDWGMTNVHLHKWGPFGTSWQLDSFNVEVTGINPWKVVAYPKAWTPSIEGTLEAEVVYIGDMDADTLKAADLDGKIVLTGNVREVREDFEGEARRFADDDLKAMETGGRSQAGRARAGRMEMWRQRWQRMLAMQRIMASKKPAALLDVSSKGDYGTIFVTGARAQPDPKADNQGGGRRRGPSAQSPGAKVLPQFTLAVEHFNRIVRMLRKGQKVKMALQLETRTFESDLHCHNVIAEIPGTDPQLKDEVVMLGAHFDSWHSGTGATDNGCGSAVMMEAARLLTVMMKETGMKPRRTIRIALWSGEEQGLLGSRAWVRDHLAVGGGRRGGAVTEKKPAYDKFSAYYNLDNGTGRIRGVYLQGNAACGPIFSQWLAPFADLDAKTINPGDTGGTDHQSFDGVGLPGFQFIQDTVAYSTRTHHSNMDNWDHAVAEDLQQAATIIASFVWHTSQRDARLPREAPAQAADATGRRR